jgi:hypothetical protein
LASYHFSVQVVSRGGGRSSVACAAYRAAQKLTCERDGLVHDYTRKQGVLHSEIALPEHAPERWLDRSTLWNEVEATERRADAQLARETVFAVPHELSREQQVEFCREAVRELYVSRGMVCDWAMHDADGDGHNVHCHVLSSLRSCDESGFLAKSVNVYTVRNADGEERKAATAEFRELREHGWEKVYKYRLGNEYRELTASQADGWDGCKRVSKNAVQEARYLNDWNNPGNVERWRAEFCDLQNAALERAGSAARVDHRSYEARGIDREPTVHEGPAVRAMESRERERCAAEGREYAPVTDRARENEAVRERNAALERLREGIEWAQERARELARFLRIFDPQRERMRRNVERVRDMARDMDGRGAGITREAREAYDGLSRRERRMLHRACPRGLSPTIDRLSADRHARKPLVERSAERERERASADREAGGGRAAGERRKPMRRRDYERAVDHEERSRCMEQEQEPERDRDWW